jgi:hypothetical protein
LTGRGVAAQDTEKTVVFVYSKVKLVAKRTFSLAPPGKCYNVTLWGYILPDGVGGCRSVG